MSAGSSSRRRFPAFPARPSNQTGRRAANRRCCPDNLPRPCPRCARHAAPASRISPRRSPRRWSASSSPPAGRFRRPRSSRPSRWKESGCPPSRRPPPLRTSQRTICRFDIPRRASPSPLCPSCRCKSPLRPPLHTRPRRPAASVDRTAPASQSARPAPETPGSSRSPKLKAPALCGC